MHILIATTGVLPAPTVVEFTARLLCGSGRVTVCTVIEVPRDFLETLESDSWNPLEDGGGSLLEGGRAELLERYVEERGRRLTEPIVHGLEAAGVDVAARFLDGENPAKLIAMLAEDVDADLVVLGATRQIFDDQVWQSVSAQVMAESSRPVLVLPSPAREPVIADTAVE